MIYSWILIKSQISLKNSFLKVFFFFPIFAEIDNPSKIDHLASTLKLFLIFFEPCAWFKTIYVKKSYDAASRNSALGQKKTNKKKRDFPLKLHINRVFFCALPLYFNLFIRFICSKNVCKNSLTHITAKKCNFCLKK